MESAVAPAMHLLPQWLTRLLEDCSEEEDPDETFGVKCLRGHGRVAMWNMCTDMGVSSHGIPGQACRLLERFITAQLRDFEQQNMSLEEWQEAKCSVIRRLPLLMVSCVQLAVKMSCADIPMNASVGRAFLGSRGVHYSAEDIKESEYKVFRMLGFRIPLWTSVETGEALAVGVGMPLGMLGSVAAFVNLTEFYRDKLESRVRWAAAPASGATVDGTNLSRAFLATLHLAAGAVVACARVRACPGPSPGPRLAELTQAPLCYIRCIADVIISIVEGSSPVDSPRKRTFIFSDSNEDSDNPRKRRKD